MRNLREPVNVLTHFCGAILALCGLIWLASLSDNNPTKRITVIIYGCCMILTYLASTALHYHHGRWQPFFQRLDHASIYTMIAGAYTPLGYHLLEGQLRLMMLGSVWGMALLGAFIKLFFFWQGNLSTLAYVLFGVFSVLPAPKIWLVMETGLLLLVIGSGLIFTAGALIYALRKPNFHRHFGHHELWHVFVLLGNAVHFSAVLLYVVGI